VPKTHPLFSREGDDIHQTIGLDLIESLCGWKRFITTIEGSQIAIEKSLPTQPGSSDVYPGLGMPLSKKPGTRGNFVIKYEVKYPSSLTPRAKAMIKSRLYYKDGGIDSVDP
jgi:DnaJ family protein B protein 4